MSEQIEKLIELINNSEEFNRFEKRQLVNFLESSYDRTLKEMLKLQLIKDTTRKNNVKSIICELDDAIFYKTEQGLYNFIFLKNGVWRSYYADSTPLEDSFLVYFEEKYDSPKFAYFASKMLEKKDE